MSTCSAIWSAISSWLCGRLPMPVVAQGGRSERAFRTLGALMGRSIARELTGSRHRVVERRRVVEHEGGHGRLRLHHAAVGELDADLLRPQRLEEQLLVLQPGARRIPEREALALVLGAEALQH